MAGEGTAYSKRDYRAARAALRRNPAPCVYCGKPATTLDHVPALVLHEHEPGTGCCELHPSCAGCNFRHGARLGNRRRRHRRMVAGEVERSDTPSRAW